MSPFFVFLSSFLPSFLFLFLSLSSFVSFLSFWNHLYILNKRTIWRPTGRFWGGVSFVPMGIGFDEFLVSWFTIDMQCNEEIKQELNWSHLLWFIFSILHKILNPVGRFLNGGEKVYAIIFLSLKSHEQHFPASFLINLEWVNPIAPVIPQPTLYWTCIHSEKRNMEQSRGLWHLP